MQRNPLSVVIERREGELLLQWLGHPSQTGRYSCKGSNDKTFYVHIGKTSVLYKPFSSEQGYQYYIGLKNRNIGNLQDIGKIFLYITLKSYSIPSARYVQEMTDFGKQDVIRILFNIGNLIFGLFINGLLQQQPTIEITLSSCFHNNAL